MKHVQGVLREEMQISCLEENIEKEDEIRVIDKIVEELDLKKIGYQEKVRKNNAGRPRYDAKTMIKLYIYGYRKGIRSGRKLEEACKYDIRFQWLLNKRMPDANTINDFRKEQIEMLRKMFYEINRKYIELGIIKIREVSQDGFKIKAQNSKEKNYTVNKVIDRIAREEKEKITLEEEVKKTEKYIKDLERAEEIEEYERIIEEKKKEIEELEKREEKHKKMLKEMEEEGKSQISLTDPESRLMRNNGKYEVAYNNQTAVDVESHITLAYQTDNNPADVGSMSELMEVIQEEYEGKTEGIIKNITDKGYQSITDMMECLEKGVIPEVTPTKKETKEIELETEYEEAEITEEMKKSEKREDIKKCIRAGIIPDCYQNEIKKIEVVEKEVREERKEEEKKEIRSSEEIREEAISKQTFERDINKGIVYCPGGEILAKKSQRKDGKIRYANKMACANCKNPCTKSKYKEVEFREGQKTLIPKNNQSEKPRVKVKNKKIKKKVVKVKLKIDKELLKKRMQTSEHTQGTMKTVDNYSHFSMRGKEKASGELGLYLTASNIRRVCNMIGVKELLRKLEGEEYKNTIKMLKKCLIMKKIAIFG